MNESVTHPVKNCFMQTVGLLNEKFTSFLFVKKIFKQVLKEKKQYAKMMTKR